MDLRHLSGQEGSLCNRVGHEKERRGEEGWKWHRTGTPGKGLGERRGSCTQGTHSQQGVLVGTEGDFLGIRRECSYWSVGGRMEWGLWSVPQPSTPQARSCVSWWGGSLGTGEWGLEGGPREGTAADGEKMA